MHWDMPFATLLVMVFLEFYTLDFLQKCLLAISALGRGMTLNEFSHTEQYRYLFEPVSIKKNFDESKVKHDYERVPFSRTLLNPFKFFFDCSRKPLKSRRLTQTEAAEVADPPRGGLTRYSLLSKDPVASN